MKQMMMTLAALLLCATQANAQTARVADRELIGAWTLEWMQYDGEKKIVCGKANGYTQFKYYGADGEYAAAGIVLSNEGKIVVIPQEYGKYSLKDGWYMEMGRPAIKDAVILTDKTHYRGRWKNRSDLWVKHPSMSDKIIRYIVERCKMNDTPADVQQLIKHDIFK
ncbi:MAG: hypothetical protein K6D37_03175 [Prevotella sp.]|jgi:hypothetical protein|nr:hypothetical protein [Prevotella sp.]